MTGKFLFFSPNLVWLVIALLDYFLFPYDYQAAKKFENFNWVLYRCPFIYTHLYFKIRNYR